MVGWVICWGYGKGEVGVGQGGGVEARGAVIDYIAFNSINTVNHIPKIRNTLKTTITYYTITRPFSLQLLRPRHHP